MMFTQFGFQLRRKTLTVFSAVMLGAVLFTAPAQAQEENQSRTWYFGSSGGNVNDTNGFSCCSGTLGSLLEDDNGGKYILSNWHVLAKNANFGDDVSQPGLVDGAVCSLDGKSIVANLSEAALNTGFGTQGIDAAIAQLREGEMDGEGNIVGIGRVSVNTQDAYGGLGVTKSGRTTGVTNGSVIAVGVDINVSYPVSCGSPFSDTYRFENQIFIQGDENSFSAGGDSGSLIVTNDWERRPVALLFAGNSSITVANPINAVLEAFGGSRPGLRFVGNSYDFGSHQSTGNHIRQGKSLIEGVSAQEAERVKKIKEKNANALLKRNGILGVGIGRYSDKTNEAAVVVFVDRAQKNRVRVPRTLENVRVKVVYTDPIVAQ